VAGFEENDNARPNGETMNIRHGSQPILQGVMVFIVGATVALILPLTPLMAGALELARFDTELAIEWLSTSAAQEIFEEVLRELEWQIAE
jgi:hypothetical protein